LKTYNFPKSGKVYNSNNKIISPFDSFSESRKAVRITRNDYSDRSFPVFRNLGNFGSSPKEDTGVLQIKQATIDTELFAEELGYTESLFVIISGVTLIFKSNVESFGENKIIRAENVVDGTLISKREYKNIVEFGTVAEDFDVWLEAAKITGTTYNLYKVFVNFRGDINGLVLRQNDFYRVSVYDTSEEEDQLSHLDVPLATIGVQGYVIPNGVGE